MWICRCQPMAARRLPNAMTSSIVRTLAEMRHVMEARAAEACGVEPLAARRPKSTSAPARRRVGAALCGEGVARRANCRSRAQAICTITQRSMPRHSCSANSSSFGASAGCSGDPRRRESARPARTRAHARRRRRAAVSASACAALPASRAGRQAIGGLLRRVGARCVRRPAHSWRSRRARRPAPDRQARHSTGLRQSR